MRWLVTAVLAFIGAFAYAKHVNESYELSAWVALGVACTALTGHRIVKAMDP